MAYQLDDLSVECDEQGFIKDLADWSAPLAQLIAAQEQIILGDDHWLVLNELRKFYQEFEQSPSMRVFSRLLKQSIGEQYASSMRLMQLFGESPVKMACKIAGLPKPRNCL